jgi:hypothetical protein
MIPDSHRDLLHDKLGAKYSADLRDRDQPGDSRAIVTLRPARVRVWG